MPIGPLKPTETRLQRIADRIGFDLGDREIADYARLIGGTMAACRILDSIPEQLPPVRYPRTSGFRPSPESNRLNGWTWRCDIEGTAEGVLKGKQIGVKDAVCVAGVPMRNGSKMLEGFTPDIDATVVTRILDAGGKIVGKTNCEDLSFSGAGYTSALGAVANPYDPSKNPGGSSSGSAAVLASGEVDASIGGDQGGSIRIPAAWSGVYGLKPTYGLVPYTGVAPIEMTLDHVGPMANTTEDLARLLQAIAGRDPLDPRQRGTYPSEFIPDYLTHLQSGIAGKKIAILKEGFGRTGEDLGVPPFDPEVDETVRNAVQMFASLGASIDEISIPEHLLAGAIWNVIATIGSAEFMIGGAGNGTNSFGYYNSSLGVAFERAFKARPNDLPYPAVTCVLANEYLKETHGLRYYWKAQNQRHLILDAINAALSQYDILAMPTIPFTATASVSPDVSIGDYVGQALNNTHNCVTTNLTGHPSISIPCGLAGGLPVGMMLIARHYEDALLLQASAAFEALTVFKPRGVKNAA
ncbi:amidase [Agrobacterium rosae]|uniref:Indoleacetamide hydrolase n=1 Tax=Agrobacterium rosae TaxID=1972867 RepID=A0A1R3U3C3_9HYPH|nr:amidase [Agrobacterium rosae]SCX36107.1 Amidase [Agrobacterium rosae]